MRRLLLATTLLTACGDWTQDAVLTEADQALLAGLVLPGEAPPDPSNHLVGVAAAERLGHALFFDARLSSPPGVSCAACHAPGAWFIDTASRPNNVSTVQPIDAAGVRLPVRTTKRNSPSLVNVAHYRWWGWDGRSDSLWMQCAVAYESPRTMDGRRERLAQAINDDYRDLALDPQLGAAKLLLPRFEPFPSGRAEVLAVVGYKSMAAYLAKLNSDNAPFDRFALGDRDAISAEARAGFKLFVGKAGCFECHSGPAFNGSATAQSDGELYRSVGVAQRGPGVDPVDDGRADGLTALLTGKQALFNTAGPYNDAWASSFNRVHRLAAAPTDRGLFRIKSLRQVAETAPYMHAGQLATLEDVVHSYNVGGDPSGFSGSRDRLVRPLGLTAAEEHQLVEFLRTLTGRPIPPSLTCDASAAPVKGASLCDGGVGP